MRYLRALFFTTFVSLMLASIVSFFPTVEMSSGDLGDHGQSVEPIWPEDKEGASSEPQDNRPVFQLEKPLTLSKDVIVPFFKQITVHYPYQNIQLDNESLFVVTKLQPEETLKQDYIYKDAIAIMSDVFVHTHNIEKLYLRVVREHELQPQLIVAVNSKRKDLTEEALQEVQSVGTMSENERESWIKANTDLVHGTGWRN
ncbi:hypothetical protein [Caldalkalibacillus salinus]|uniref:hypothetical protein n=1 Tax=Caldalkalibacillus salinus TaxID=2803787 RepID=UPI001922ECE1|nr:hypothetical protein [Caldalkalibacillus salinus]